MPECTKAEVLNIHKNIVYKESHDGTLKALYEVQGFLMEICRLKQQGFSQGSCLTYIKASKLPLEGYYRDLACKVTLKWQGETPLRLIKSILLSRPEDYLSIYQSGCNLSCLKCHSWEFSKYKNGKWFSPGDIARVAKEYATVVTVREPKNRVTSFHANDLCHHCGSCVIYKRPSPQCPGRLRPDQILLSPQGFGPARNIIAFTGGDLACNPEWYCKTTELIKGLDQGLWVLFETNGYGLTSENLDVYKASGIDSFWLDIKAFDNNVHRRLTGVDNTMILRLPEEILKKGFTLEVLSLFIPGWVETDQIKEIAKLLAKVDVEIPFTILAFFGEYKLKDIPSPNLNQMLGAYRASKEAGLKNVRLGNLGVFIKTDKDLEIFQKTINEI